MKKLFTLLLTLGSFSAVFAQGGRYNDRSNNDYAQRNHDVVMNNDHGRNTQYGNVYNYPQSRNNDWQRQQEMDRVNHDYDRRINDYRNDRSLSPYERDRRITQAERERKEKTGSFVKGAVVGGVAGAILGVLLSK